MMMVLVKTDNHVEGSDQLSADIESMIHHSLDRFAQRVTRIEAKLFDDNSREKDGPDDMRCVVEARPAGPETDHRFASRGNDRSSRGRGNRQDEKDTRSHLQQTESSKGARFLRRLSRPAENISIVHSPSPNDFFRNTAHATSIT